ncbi:putative TPR repeat-containing protein [Cocos nucifera]|nr:putative TPR repeat-containing protein [Cocos nucifera]
MATARGGVTPARREKVRRIFERFDANRDGGLDRSEMAALVAAVNPSVHFTQAQVDAILDEVFRSYADFIPDPAVGLSLAGLLRTYDDGAGDVDRDFAALSILDPATDPNSNPSPAADPDLAPDPNPRLAPAWVSSPNHGIAHENTWRVVEDLEFAIR